VFVDHCVDLAHNGGLAFNKGYIIANPSSESDYMTMLNEKKEGWLSETSTLSHPIVPAVANLVADGVGLSMLKRPRKDYRIVPDVDVPTLTWGDELVTLYDGHVGGSYESESVPVAVPSISETYPER